MNPNSDNSKSVKNNQTDDAQARISHYATRFADYDDAKLQETVEHERKVRGWGSGGCAIDL